MDFLKDLNQPKVYELKKAFCLFDLDGDGVISEQDLKNTFLTLGVDKSDYDIDKMFDGVVQPLNLDVFLLLILQRANGLAPQDVMLGAFRMWDKANAGYIDKERFIHDITTYGDRFSLDEANEALEDAVVTRGPQLNADGQLLEKLDYVDFVENISGFQKSDHK
ncbi:myosin regulatory light chain, smooth muscle [Anopheles ziemanni]|uniref:myosin regulatory light chain, smooth muscle n=1 Tax=Anopheles coustani TaxID=139045 RepID=UPI002659EAB2|nr:myosin regulatory light chain, smooth muscle [Anopheles coustani]XP_058173999.1 myosin regulatory light chain, smooth muscle [Anopheles ziemanni]